MKKLLLLLMCVLSSMGGWAQSTVTYDGSNPVITTNGDAGLSDVQYSWGGSVSNVWNLVSNWNITYLGVNGNLSQTGLDRIQTDMNNENSTFGGNNDAERRRKLDLSGATFTGTITTLPDDSRLSGILLPPGTSLDNLTIGSNTQYVYSASDGTSPVNLYVSSDQTTIPSEITSDVINTINTNGINLSGDGSDNMKQLLIDAGVDASKIAQAFNGKVDVIGGSVQSDVETALTENSSTADKVKELTVTSGTLTNADVTYINGTLTGLTSIDLSSATATSTQIVSLLDNSSATSITLGSSNINNLKNASGATIDMSKIADNVTGSQIASGMTNTNYIIDGNTLIVTGLMSAQVESELNQILANNPDITTLDVSNATNTSDYNIAEIAQITQVNLPSGGHVTYGDENTNVIALVDGVLEVSIKADGTGDYTDVASMLSALSSVLGDVKHLKITGDLTATDLANLFVESNNTTTIGGVSTIETLDLSDANFSISDLTSLSRTSKNDTPVLLPAGTDLTDRNTWQNWGTNFYSVDADNPDQMNLVVGYAGSDNNGLSLSRGAYFLEQEGSTILKPYPGRSASGASGAAALNAYAEYDSVSIIDLTDANTNNETGVAEAMENLTNVKTVLSPVTGNKLVVSGPLTNDVLEALSSMASDNITSIDFSGATPDGNLDWSNLSGYDNVEYVMLPASVATNALDKTTLPALKAAGNYDETSKTGAIHVYEEVTSGATKGFAATFPGTDQYGNSAAVFAEAEGLTLTGTLNANSLVLTNANSTTAIVGSSLKSVNLTTTQFESGVTPRASMIVSNDADIIAPTSLSSTTALEDYAASNGNNGYSNVYAIDNGTAHVLVNNTTTFNSRNADYLSYAGNVSTMAVHTSPTLNANGLASLADFNGVDVDELDFSEAYIQNNNAFQTLANTNISSLVMNGTHGAYNNKISIDISGCTNLTSADLRLADGQLNQVNATGLSNLLSLQLTEASFSKAVTETSTTLTEGYVDVTNSNLSNMTVYGDSEFNEQRIIPADQVNIEEGAAPAYKVNGCQITINMPDPRIEGEGLQDYLSEAISKMAASYNEVICRLTINGPVTSEDIQCAALTNAKAAIIDMQGAQFVDDNGDTDNSLLGSFSNSYVEHLATPYGCDDILALSALGSRCSSLTVVGTYGATEEGAKDNTKFTAYSFESNNMLSFITDLFPEINNNLRYSSQDDSEHYPTSLTLGGHIGDKDLVNNNEKVFKSDKLYNFDLTECDFDENCTVSIKSTDSYGGTENEKTGVYENPQQLTCTSTNAMYYLSAYTPTSVILPKYDTEIPPCTFNSISKSVLLENITFPEGSNYTKIGFEAFYMSGLEQIRMPGTVTQVGEGAFGSMPNMTDFTMEACKTTCVFGEKTFSGSKNIKHVTLSEGVEDVSYMMFNQCASLEEIRIPNSCTTIESYAFNLCFTLHSLTIPRGVEQMGRGVITLSGVKDIFILAESIDEVPLIYAVPNDKSGYIGTFGDQNINGNNTDPRNGTREHSDLSQVGWEEGLTWYQEELSGSAGLGTGNCMTLLHFPDAMRDFYDGYGDPDDWKDDVTAADTDILAEKIKLMEDTGDEHNWISDGYGYGSIEYDRDYNGNKGNSDVHLITGGHQVIENGHTVIYPQEEGDSIVRTWPVQSDYAIRRAVGAVGSYDANSKQIRTAEAWRQFPLMTGVAEEGKKIIPLEYDDTWYTMCFPWHLTDTQLFEAFNQKCEITEFMGVELIEQDGSTETDRQYALVLHFDDVAKTYYMDKEDNYYKREKIGTKTVTYNGVTITQNMYRYTLLTGIDGEETSTTVTDVANYDEKNHTAEEAEQHVLYLSIQNIIPLSCHPYMIHPSVGASPGTPTTCNLIAVEDKMSADMWNTKDQAVTRVATTGEMQYADGKNTRGAEAFVNPKTGGGGSYTFVGNVGYEVELFKNNVTNFEGNAEAESNYIMDEENDRYGAKNMPLPAYFLAVNPNLGSNDQIYPKYYRKKTGGEKKWSRFSAIIRPDAAAMTNIEAFLDFEAAANGFNIALGEWEVVTPTAIEQIVAEAERNNEPVQKIHLDVVYNIKGQIVRNGSTSLEGLPKGLYIVKGKKYMVK